MIRAHLRVGAAASACALVLLATASAPAGGEPRASLPDIEDEVMCPICGTPLELSSSPQAERQRALIRRLIDRGETKSEIKDALVSEYGPEVLAVPSDDGFELTAWLVPPALIAVAGGAAAFALWRRRGGQREGAGGPQALEPAEASRLERELRSYDL